MYNGLLSKGKFIVARINRVSSIVKMLPNALNMVVMIVKIGAAAYKLNTNRTF